MSLVLCTALQISLTKLLQSWNIYPTAITSHSSGEVAAAYAAGALTAYDAMAIVYSRMQLSTPTMGYNGEAGGMLAVGVGKHEVVKYLQALTKGQAVIACDNSQESVTISGDILAIEELEGQLTADGIFARKLKVGMAYHSHHMLAASTEYLESITRRLSSRRKTTSRLMCRLFSPVTGTELHSATAIDAQHWVNNMTRTVLFSSAFQSMCTETDLDIIVEVGPHGALGGPIRQIQKHLSYPGKRVPAYVACLTRGEDATICMKKLAGELWKRGQPISSDVMGSDLPGKVLVDLPTYPWTHDRKHWQEPIRNHLHRFKKSRAHDLLGSLEVDCNPHTPSWRNIIRASNLPWIRHHQVQGNIILPGAGLICMAIEGVAQLKSSKILGRMELENVNITQALVVPDDDLGVELRLSLKACSEKELRDEVWYEFHVVSRNGADDWVEHCSGSIAAWPAEVENTHGLLPELQELLIEKQSLFHRHQVPQDFYNDLRMSEIYHGPTFQNIVDIRKHQTTSVCKIKIAATEATMPKEFESSYIIHPATLDNIFQAAYTAVPSSTGYQGARVPRFVKSLLIKVLPQVPQPGDILETRSFLHYDQARGFCSSAVSCDHDGGVVVEVDHLFCQAIGSAREKNSIPGHHDLRMKQVFNTSLILNEKNGIETLLQPVNDPNDDAIIRNLTRAGFYYIHNALRELNEVDIKSFSEHQVCFYKWMKRQIKRADLNILAEQSHQWASDSLDVQNKLLADMQNNTVNGLMTAQVGKNLVSILRNEKPPLAVMLEDKLLYRYYEEDIRSQCIYRQVDQAIELLAHEKPGLRILEIGAGTGGCTSAVLGSLHGREAGLLTSYDFTDISSGFFPQARQKFERWGNVISYKKLDIEGDIASQGFDEAKYDGIVACRVLHATRNMAATMANVHKLLKPGGWLLLVEDTTETLDLSLVFGVLPGWWLSEETFRQNGPLLREDQWHTLLRDTGFSGVDFIVHDREDAELRSASLMMSRRTDVPDSVPMVGQIVLLWYSTRLGPPPSGWVDQVRKALTAYTIIPTAIDSLEAVKNCTMLQDGAACIVLDHSSSKHSLLANINEEDYESIKSVLTSSGKVLWVASGGALSSPNCEAALHLGLLRTLRCEHAEAKYVSLDLDTRHDCWSDSSVRTIVSVATKTILATHLGPLDIESECAERGGLLLVPRVFPVQENSSAQQSIQPFQQSDQHIRLSVANPGLLDSIYFTASRHLQGSLANDEVDIAPAVFGLNFRDVMVALGQLDTDIMGFECSGIVQAAGSATGLQPGERVCALLRGHWSNTVRVHCSSVARIPDKMSMQVAATVPMVFITAYCALVETARCRRGQTILIHAAAGGVGQAAVKLAQWLEMEVFVTAGTPEKRDFLQKTYQLPASHIFSSRDDAFAARLMEATNQRGVDVVLNSLSGPLLRKTWQCLARFGHFVEIGKRDIEQNACLDMSAFGRNVSFSSIDLIQIGHFNQPMIRRSFSKVMELFASDQLQPVGPIHEYPISEIKSAMRLMQMGRHMGKIVVSAVADVEVVNNSVARQLSSDATYLIVGGLGGLGLAILEHFFELGAKNLLVISRSARSSADNSAAVNHLRKRGCRLTGLDCDISSFDSLTASLEWARANLPPIRGVVQAAMVLKDSIFETMSYSDFSQALNPKLTGTRNLHSCFSNGSTLDFFITLSSLSGVAGSASQANYASGGTYQDALMRHRASLGLPGVCIDLGIVKAVGYVSQNPKVAERLAKLLYRPMEEHEVMHLIDEAITFPIRTCEASQVITGFVAGTEAEPYPSGVAWRREPRFRGMVKPSTSATNDGSDTAKGNIDSGASTSMSLYTELKTCPTGPEARQIIARGIQQKLSEMFMIPVDELDIMEPLSKYGVDSLVAVELRNWLVAQTESTVTIFDVMQSEHTVDLARRAASSSKHRG
jgi:NADPH:quinone reductase-like Zn-dependent oxidoreductase/malonyl CoA-acyl carrier protein transacylase/ubiquinone/menaquinone biosynthesis C-methylase UbiE